MLAALSLLLPVSAFAFTVQTFQPEGTVREPRQARAVFSEPMVPFGDPRGLAPFTVDCAEKGKGIWEDSRTWIYEFESDQVAGETCRFEGKTDLKSQQGTAWTGPTAFRFDTGGPAIKRAQPYEGSTIPQLPALVLKLDGPVNPATVEKNVYFLSEGMAERIPVKILPEKTLRALAKSFRQTYYDGGEEEGDSGPAGKKKPKPFLIGIESTRALPPDHKIQLVWGKGVAAPSGAATTEDQFFAYRTETKFTAKFHCERENENAPCLPIGSLSLDFSAPISHADAAKIRLHAGWALISPFPKVEGKQGGHRPRAESDEESYVRFAGPFPPNASLSLELPKNLRDDRGRALTNAGNFPLSFRTGGYPPLAKFPAAFGIVEAQDPVMPVTLRNVEANIAGEQLEGARISVGPGNPAEVLRWIFRLHKRASQVFKYEGQRTIDLRGDALLADQPKKQAFSLPKPNGAEAFEVVGIPLGKKGFHVVEIGSKLLGQSLMAQPRPMYVASGALVTNMAVHLKWGAENSLVWVTHLDDAKPVAGAHLRAADCTGKIVWEGKTDDLGTAIAADFPSSSKMAECSGGDGEGFRSGVVVEAQKDDDFSLVYSGWDNGIEEWRFHVPTGGNEDETVAHAVFDRTLLRAGQSMHLKVFLRENFLRGTRFRRGNLPNTLVIKSAAGHTVQLPASFDGSGAADADWAIPKEAELGTYEVYLASGNAKKSKKQAEGEEEFSPWQPGVYAVGSFRVEEFRLPVMSGSIQWPAGAQVGVKSVSGDLAVRYLSGGGAAGLPVKLRARATKQEGFSFPAFEGFDFANGGVATGRFDRGANKRREDKREVVLPEQLLSLDQSGGGRIHFGGLPAWDVPARLSVEAEYHDPNGAVQTVSRSVTTFPTAALVGIRPDGWVAQADHVKFRVAVASPEGKPLAGRAVTVRWLEKNSFSHRKRIVGGFYAYENFEEVRDRGPACAGTTDTAGLLFCEGPAPASGNLELVAEVRDGERASRAHHDLFVAGADDWWFAQENDDRIDLLPERKSYEPGETARFQVRSPFREATALVTVEREGILDRYVVPVSGKDPVIEVPVKNEYSPNVFVSALLVRGRVADPKATALVDLARPSHKLGLAPIQVGWKPHRLDVTVATDRAEYRVRDHAKVKVKVTRALDGAPAAKGEVLLVAVDEALLELMPNNSWDLLSAMMGERSLRVRTSTAQSQVVGKRHFGLKALPPGGGGGMSSARELFDTLLFWKARLSLDRHGEAEAEVPMNDSLSSFRIVAVASEDADRFGTGSHSVRTRQDLMLFSGVSPLARFGDEVHPEVTVRNSGDHALTASVAAKVEGHELGAQKVELAPGASRTVAWPFTVPSRGPRELHFEFEARANDAHDALKVTQTLEPALRESLLQGTLERLDGHLSMPVAIPAGAVPGTGGVNVRLTRRLAANLEGVRSYMTEYPFDCLEQRTSRAVALSDAASWKKIAAGLGAYVDRQGLLKYFPDSLYGSDALSSYVLAIANEAGFPLPSNELPVVIRGLTDFVTGKQYYAGFAYPAADLAIRKLAAMEALSRYQSFDPAWLSLIQIEPNLWPMRALLDWSNLLHREQKIPDRAKRLAEVEQILRARVEWRGTTIAFRNETPLWWLMNSPDEDANRFLLAAAGDDQWKNDIGRVARGAVGRLRSGHWDLTTANAWGVLALARFSARFENEAVTGETAAALAGHSAKAAWAPEQDPAPLSFPWPPAKAELSVDHHGTGKPWAFLDARAAVKLAEPIFKGYRLERQVTPVEQKVKGHWSPGDVYRVRLDIEAIGDMTWVVVSDPVPAGATVLGSGLGGDSASLTAGEKNEGWGYGRVERSFSGFRQYFEWLPRGKRQIEYTVRLNQAGVFQMPNSRIEAMYAPEMYAERPIENLKVSDTLW